MRMSIMRSWIRAEEKKRYRELKKERLAGDILKAKQGDKGG